MLVSVPLIPEDVRAVLRGDVDTLLMHVNADQWWC